MPIENPIDKLFQKNPDFSHFREIMEMIPIIQQKSIESIYKEITNNPHNNKRMEYERGKIRDILEITTSKWSTDILYLILVLEKPYYNDILKSLKGINSRSLTDRLKLFEEKRIIKRNIEETRPLRVYYTLTKYGLGLISIFNLIYLYSMFHEEIDKITEQSSHSV